MVGTVDNEITFDTSERPAARKIRYKDEKYQSKDETRRNKINMKW